MKIHHLNCGTMRPFGGSLIDGRPNPLRRAAMVCHCLLIETDGGLVLVDSGLLTRKAAPLPRGYRLITAPDLGGKESAAHHVERLGFSAEDVRHVVLTHLDLDHAGGLPDFPGAKVHVHAEEHRAAMAPRTRAEHGRYLSARWSHGPDWQTYEAEGGEDWFGFHAVRQLVGLPPEILLVPLVGHTKGHAGVAVRTDDSWLLHAGDAYFFHGEMDPDNPRSTQGLRLFQSIVQTEPQARLSNQERLRSLIREQGEKVEVFSAHDPVELRRYTG